MARTHEERHEDFVGFCKKVGIVAGAALAVGGIFSGLGKIALGEVESLIGVETARAQAVESRQADIQTAVLKDVSEMKHDMHLLVLITGTTKPGSKERLALLKKHHVLPKESNQDGGPDE